MGILYFLDSRGGKRVVQEYIEKNDACCAIHNYVHELNPDFKIYYIRSWEMDKGVTRFDVGSHTEFFEHVEESNT